MSQTVSVKELQVGMYVHLDLSWMSHPFPRSSFRLDSEDQIRIIRGLGLQQLRWDPARSVLPAAGVAAPDPGPPISPMSDAGAGDPAAAPADAFLLRRRALQSQREAERVCEAQYEEAGQALQQAFERLRSDPQAARLEVESLSRALREKMLGEGDTCIRVLNAAAGDRASAHSMNVAVVAMLLGRRLGLSDGEVSGLGTGAMLHDVGKLDLPELVRHPDSRFSAAEQAAYASHVELGLRQARRMGLDDLTCAIIAQHHELADRSGFPHGLGADDVSLQARIVGLVNRFDNLCNPAVLAQAMTPHEALSSLFAHHQGRYDLTVLQAFIRMMGVYPAGSLVQLTDERYAMVVSANANRPLKPRVLVYDPGVPREDALHVELQRTPDLGIRRSFRAAQLPRQALDYLAPRPRVSYFFESLAAPRVAVEELVV